MTPRRPSPAFGLSCRTSGRLLSRDRRVGFVAVGTLATYANALQRGWQPLIPPAALWTGLGAAVLVGAIAGLYPAQRAARLAPVDALRTT